MEGEVTHTHSLMLSFADTCVSFTGQHNIVIVLHVGMCVQV